MLLIFLNAFLIERWTRNDKRMHQSLNKRVAIIGGGAAGFFTALSLAEQNTSVAIDLFEKRKEWLSKVRVSGGGRCNVTHHCFDPKQLSEHYPRGSRELRAAFHAWQPTDTIAWFEERGIDLKTEVDGRMFPTTDDSQTIIDCFMSEVAQHSIQLKKGQGVESISVTAEGQFLLKLDEQTYENYDAVCLALGSMKGSSLEGSIQKLGHHIEPLAPSLFAFNVNDSRVQSLSGVSVPKARVWLDSIKQSQMGPLLITHRGMSGPAILKLSAWRARTLKDQNYHFTFYVNWLGVSTHDEVLKAFNPQRIEAGKRSVKNTPLFELPKRLWESLVSYAQISNENTWSQLSKKAEQSLITELIAGRYEAQGKTTNKEEFVTCGGVSRKEIDFKSMESKCVPKLFFAGECIDIDGITGGFNFQAAWTTGRLAGSAMAQI